MTPAAARAALAGALHDDLGDRADAAASRILRELHRDGWHISPDPAADTHARYADRDAA